MEETLFDSAKQGLREGEHRATRGMMAALVRAGDLPARAQIAMLQAALSRESRTFTSDDADVDGLHQKRPGGGKWMGAALKSLALAGITRGTNQYCKSCRPARNGGLVRVWQIVSDDAASKLLEQLRRQIGGANGG